MRLNDDKWPDWARLGAFLIAGSFAFALPAARVSAQSRTPSAERVDFTRDIEPILENRCVRCHNEKKHKAGLRLDSKSAAMSGSYFGTQPVILPGNAQSSELFSRISSEDEELRMPPSGAALPMDQVELIRRWIDEGASWPDDAQAGEPAHGYDKHWAYARPERAELPRPARADQADWPLNAIDFFVLDALAEQGLEPSPEADRPTLLRRLSLDLLGLPPSPEEIESFVSDDSPDAYERLVDRLLASPHYGERQARAWLDLARYADTNGYEKDSRRTMWRYRDWVIDAFNADLGFDQFTIEQLAGDLLPDATVAELTATGFHRNTMINAEGGVDPEEYRVAAVVDRVNTTASVWLGSTIACAQCHTHKYDPFSQREYYRLFAYFNSTADIGPGDEPKIEAPTASFAEREALAVQELQALDAKLTTWTPSLAIELEAFEANRGATDGGWTVLRPTRFTSTGGSTLALLDDASVLALGELPETDTYEFEFELRGSQVQRLRVEVMTHETLPDGGPGRTSHRNFVLSEVELEGLGGEGQAAPRALVVQHARADFHQTGSPEWPARAVIDGDAKTGWAIGGAQGEPHQLVLELQEPLDGRVSPILRVRLAQMYGSGHVIGRLRVSSSDLAGDGTQPLPPAVEGWLVQGAARTAQEDAQLQSWFLGATPTLQTARERKAELDRRPRAPTTLVMRELPEPRATHMFTRGSFLSPGEAVEPGVPAALHPLPANGPPNRLGLAQWLVSADNPLTARVTINRLWEQVFGRGLVATPEDFGSQGQAPTHPELLDGLALDLQEDGWSIKNALRRIVLSRTYRQSSEASAEQKRIDPTNRWLGRGARYRVEAEMVRDVALVASGLFNDAVGGPSVFPPQPEGIWGSTYSSDRWQAATDGERFRRGLYTFWRRTSPYPTFMAFDAPSRELACVRRAGSNTPLQALALLNDPAFIETAVALAGRLLREGGESDHERIELGFVLCTGRAADDAELEVLTELINSERRHFGDAPEDAKRLIHSEADLGIAELDPLELAAWTVLANVLLNLDETITRS